MVILNVNYSDLENEIERLCESREMENYTEEALVTRDINEGDAVVAFEPAYRVVDKNLIAVEGDYCVPNEESGTLEPDWSLTLIYENVPDEEFDADNWLYLESGGSVGTAIHNFTNFKKVGAK